MKWRNNKKRVHERKREGRKYSIKSEGATWHCQSKQREEEDSKESLQGVVSEETCERSWGIWWPAARGKIAEKGF